ncbi:MAG: IS1 family transposase [Candidatus Woesearchaeota archaeon]|nr:IS1 family transposase [Candidatus Woesearchaeota archaeon]
MPARPDDIVEYDELWTYVGSKQQRVWLWIALCRRTTQVVAYHLGDRTHDAFNTFYHSVPPAYAGCRSHSDGFTTYKQISKYYHTCKKKKSGRTARVEGFNNKLRQRLSRLTRKTCSFSKNLTMHEIVIRLFLQEHNEAIKSVK